MCPAMSRLTAQALTIALLYPGLCACGGGGSVSPTDPGPRTATFSGMTRIANNGVCSSLGGRHEFDAGAGTVTVTLTMAAAPRLQLQVCASSEVNHTNCTIPPFVSLPVGQSVSATLKGGRTQTVTLYPENCGAPDSPPGDPISYTVTVAYPG